MPQSGAVHLAHHLVQAIRCLTVASAGLALAMILAAVLIINHMIFVRLAGGSVVWHVELSIFLTIGAIFLGSPYAAMTRGHVAVELLESALPGRMAVPIRIGVHTLVLLVCAYLAVAGTSYAWHAFKGGLTSTSLWSPQLWPVYATLPVGLALTALQNLANIAELAIGERV